MRKENEAIKTKYTLQVQDLRRQLVTKKAFDEDESQRDISRLKKEIQFLNMQIYNNKLTKALAGNYSNQNLNQNTSQGNSEKVKRELESENN